MMIYEKISSCDVYVLILLTHLTDYKNAADLEHRIYAQFIMKRLNHMDFMRYYRGADEFCRDVVVDEKGVLV